MSERSTIERKALKVSIVGALIMSVLGIGFALRTGSEAIMLDGVFSGLGFFMAILTLRISSLVLQPDDERFNYGYSHFGPLVNLLKSAFMLLLCGFAGLSSLSALLDDGRALAMGTAVIYGAVATSFGMVLAVYLNHAAKKANSPLVALDAKSALIDALMSMAVLASFVLGYFVQGGAYEHWLPYLDPAVVVVLCLASLPMPFKVLWDSAREVLLMAPPEELQAQLMKRLELALDDLPVADHRVRMLKMGNTINLMIHVVPENPEALNLKSMDEARSKVARAVADMDSQVAFDLVFVGDISFAN